MNETLMETLANEVLRRLEDKGPRALLIGDRPADSGDFTLVTEAPYDAVLIGSLTVSELLAFSNDAICEALLNGIPVYITEAGLPSYRYRYSQNRPFLAKIQAAERQLRQLGIRPLPCSSQRRVITAQQARDMLASGQQPPKNAVLTPLAKDILEDRSV